MSSGHGGAASLVELLYNVENSVTYLLDNEDK